MRARLKTIRVKKEESAFVYNILEAWEGVCGYSTLAFRAEDPYRDLELQIPPDFETEVSAVLQDLGDLIYEIA